MDANLPSLLETVRRVGMLTETAIDALTDRGTPDDDFWRAVSSSEVFRHVSDRETAPLAYYTASRHPLKPADLLASYAVCRYLFHGPSPRTVVPERVLRHTLQSIGGAWDAWGENLPPCFIDRPSPRDRGTLVVIRGGPNKSLQSVVSELDQFAASERCVPFWHFADGGGLCIHYLMDASSEACDELERWLRHRPPLATCGRPALNIAVRVIPTGSLEEYARRRRQSPESSEPTRRVRKGTSLG